MWIVPRIQLASNTSIMYLYKKHTHFKMLVTLLVMFNLFLTTNADGFESTLGHIKTKTTFEVQEVAAMGVIRRIIPDRADSFSVVVDESIGPTGQASFQVIKQDEDDQVRIIGTSGVAAASGFHYYLKICNCHISWDSDQLALPEILPAINITITSIDRFRYYQNVCTTSYSFAWWNWQRWEREIDWMALNGFNLALAFTGQEAVWQRVYQQLNLTDHEIQEHFGGPAFLAWSRMGNLRGWGGPLTDNWHQQSLVLQRTILARMRELGIVPILPAFAGHVPRAFKRLYPDAQLTPMGKWNNFLDEYCCPYLLEPTDPLFQTVGNMFTSELIAEFGTDHVYNCDTFNEMTPQNGNATYLAQVGKAIFQAMTDVDPQAVWVTQNWMFVHDFLFWNSKRIQAFVTSVPQGRMIVLDLQSEQFPQYERTESYYGQPFIWCMLHNFGGTLGLFGSVENVNDGIFHGRNIANSTMVGTGLTPEGINQNYVVYDLMSDLSWRTEPYNLTEWFVSYSQRRYGAINSNAEEAWQLLKSSVYNFTGLQRIRGKYIISRHPSLKLRPLLWYDPSDVGAAWDQFVTAAPSLQDSLNFRHDLVDVSRQAVQLTAASYYINFVSAFKKQNVTEFQKYSSQFLELLADLDQLLASNKDFLLGNWLYAARAMGSTDLEMAMYEFNARNQITLWGPRGEIKDYANKQWAGVVSHYFLPRWQIYLSALNDSLVNDTAFDDKATARKIFLEVEERFTVDTTKFPVVEQGDSITLALELHQRWRNQTQDWNVLDQFQTTPLKNVTGKRHSLKSDGSKPQTLFFQHIWSMCVSILGV